MKLTSYPTAAEFLAAAEPTLLLDEAKSNLILGIAGRVRGGRRYGDDPPVFVTVGDSDSVIAAAIRTPPFPLILHCETGCTDAIALLVDHLAEADPKLSGVNGETSVSEAFARRWTERTGAAAEILREMRIYVLREVVPPTGVAGRLRSAAPGDVGLLAMWMRSFQEEAVPGDPPSNPAEIVRRFLDAGTLLLWEDNGPVSMAGSSRGTANSSTVSAVYTPPEKRGHGYASACVAGLSQEILDRGAAFCTLYADLANPISNKIYQRIGYRPVVDAVQYRFELAGSEDG